MTIDDQETMPLNFSCKQRRVYKLNVVKQNTLNQKDQTHAVVTTTDDMPDLDKHNGRETTFTTLN